MDCHENQRFSRNDSGKKSSSRGADLRRVESSRASEPEVAKNKANESSCEMSDCFL